MSVPICSIGLPVGGLPGQNFECEGETDRYGDHCLHKAGLRAVHGDVPRAGLEGHRVRGATTSREDPAALEQVKALGYLQAPVVITDEDHWSGFRPDKIDELASRLA